MSDIKYMDIKEFREGGFLQEVNRSFFHPLGLALEIRIDDNGAYSLGGIWDYRDDPEGIYYGNNPSAAKAANVEALFDKLAPVRMEKLGYVIQPLEGQV